MLILNATTCTGHAGEFDMQETDESVSLWATLSDRMLLGQDVGLRIPDAPEDGCIVQIRLLQEKPLTNEVMTVASVYLACSHLMEVDKERKVSSRLVVPKMAS